MTTKTTTSKSSARTTKTAAQAPLKSGETELFGMPEGLASANQGLRDAAATLRASLADYKSSRDDALKHYSEDVDAALSHMNVGIDVANAQLTAARAQTREDLATALHQADESRKALADQVKVQAHLGAMEARERSEEVAKGLSDVGHRLEAALQAVRDDTTKAWNDLWSDTTEAIGHLRRALYGGR